MQRKETLLNYYLAAIDCQGNVMSKGAVESGLVSVWHKEKPEAQLTKANVKSEMDVDDGGGPTKRPTPASKRSRTQGGTAAARVERVDRLRELS